MKGSHEIWTNGKLTGPIKRSSFPALDSMTEGETKEDAIAMGEDLILVSVFLIKQRELASMNLQEAASRLGSKSLNTYKQYEKGTINPSVGKLSSLIHAVNPKELLCISTLSF